MIDDATLEHLLAEAAAAVEVPSDGPAAVIAARDAIASTRRVHGPAGTDVVRRRGPVSRIGGAKALAAVAAAVAVALVAVGLSHGARSGHPASTAASSPTSVAGAASSATAAAGSTAGPATASGAGASLPQGAAPTGGMLSKGAPAASASGPAPTAAPVPGAEPRTVKTGTVALVVPTGKVAATLDALGADATGLGGYVQSSSATSGVSAPKVTSDPQPTVVPATAPPGVATGAATGAAAAPATDAAPSGVTGPPASGDVTLRVPVASFETLVADVTRLGTATSVVTAGNDVTGQYVDLQARISSLSAERTQYQQILSRASSIGDILAVEGQLTQVQTEIEQLQGQLAVLADQSTDSTLTVHVDEPSVVRALQPPPHRSGIAKAWAHARSSFASGIDSLVSALGGVAVFLIALLVVAVVARLAWMALRRRML